MPWLHAVLPHASRVAAAVYYRVQYGGDAVPASGPVLLVANHPNSLLDPMLVAAAAGRRVRFLAKAPLFDDLKTAWLVKGAAAIPVYRRSDDPSQMDRNQDAFRAVYEALRGGSAVGIFPEGLSHSEPALAPLKTGAARIALDGAALTGGAFPIVPVGLVFRRKDVFRSEALVLRGRAVEWDDLAPRGGDDAAAVHDLTGRIAQALRQVTLNLEQWEDRPLVETAVQVWEAERGAAGSGADGVVRLETTTRILAEARRREDPRATALARSLETHRRRLERLRLRPAGLRADLGVRSATSWAARRLHLVMPLAAILALAGFILFFVPYHATGRIVGRFRLKPDERSSWKLLIGTGVYAAWLVIVTTVAALAAGWRGAAAALVGLPALGMTGLLVRERWRGAWADARRFFLMRSRRRLVATLKEEQARLAANLHALYQHYTALLETR